MKFEIYQPSTWEEVYAQVVSTPLSDQLRKAYLTGDLKNNKDLIAGDARARILTDNLYDKKPSCLTLIVQDICHALWFRSGPGDIKDTITIHADDILEARGLPKILSGTGRRGGYRPEQRDEIEEQMRLLHSLWFSVENAGKWTGPDGKKMNLAKKSPALVVDSIERWTEEGNDGNRFWKFTFRPGRYFAEHMIEYGLQQYAQLNKNLWSFDHLKHQPEILLGYYFSWLWRIRKDRPAQLHQGVTIKKILQAINIRVDRSRPHRAKERLEKALDTLKDKNIISEWKYDDSIKIVRGHKWIERWLDCQIDVTAPAEVVKLYSKRVKIPKQKPRKEREK